jgi:hypothetical protein
MDPMIGGSPSRRKPLADDRRKSTLNIQSVKNKLVDNTKKNMAKRQSILNPMDGGFLQASMKQGSYKLDKINEYEDPKSTQHKKNSKSINRVSGAMSSTEGNRDAWLHQK